MIEVEMKNSIALLTINHPPMNVLCTSLLKEMDKALDELSKSSELRALVITGKGRAFVAGADISEMKGMSPAEALRYASLGQGVMNRIEQFPVPVIAAVNGFALGGGTELALACDVRIASEAAKFGQPEVNLGVMPGFGGTQRLPRLISPGKAKELIFTGEMIDASEALRIGLVQHVVAGYKKETDGTIMKDEKGKPAQDNEAVLSTAMEMAAKIASKGPVAIRHAKQAISARVSDGFRIEAEQFAALFDTEDQREGMTAFLEKRKADFKGR
ncbi:MAG: enoyl-CoA hydratase-related protein [Candidatus Thermoplasmatota archaeon]